MGRPLRSEQFSSEQIAVVHCIQRCVRRAFLAGVDRHSGRDYGHRKEWIRRRMEALASVFGCDVLTYAIMSNHLHIILRNRPDVVSQWSDREVAIRWLRVFPGKRLDEHLGDPSDQDVQTLCNDSERLVLVRGRLSDISWFMRALSEPIARLANKQDECTGRFWEGRFKAQSIADEAGLLACAMYVDLNPVRAALAQTPEQAQHTSAYDRIQAQRGQEIESAAMDLQPVARPEVAETLKSPSGEAGKHRRAKGKCLPKSRKRVLRDAWLSPLTLVQTDTADQPQVHGSGLRASDKGFLGLRLQQYLDLLNWTARQGPAAGGERTEVPGVLGQAVSGLGIDLKMWCDLVWNYRKYFGRSSCAGAPASMSQYAQSKGHHWVQGQAAAAECFSI